MVRQMGKVILSGCHYVQLQAWPFRDHLPALQVVGDEDIWPHGQKGGSSEPLAKHAQASQAGVNVTRAVNLLKIAIADDDCEGCGSIRHVFPRPVAHAVAVSGVADAVPRGPGPAAARGEDRRPQMNSAQYARRPGASKCAARLLLPAPPVPTCSHGRGLRCSYGVSLERPSPASEELQARAAGDVVRPVVLEAEEAGLDACRQIGSTCGFADELNARDMVDPRQSSRAARRGRRTARFCRRR